jgi:hypothetical protein
MPAQCRGPRAVSSTISSQAVGLNLTQMHSSPASADTLSSASNRTYDRLPRPQGITNGRAARRTGASARGHGGLTVVASQSPADGWRRRRFLERRHLDYRRHLDHRRHRRRWRRQQRHGPGGGGGCASELRTPRKGAKGGDGADGGGGSGRAIDVHSPLTAASLTFSVNRSAGSPGAPGAGGPMGIGAPIGGAGGLETEGSRSTATGSSRAG